MSLLVYLLHCFSSFTIPSLPRNGHKPNWTNVPATQHKHNPQHNLNPSHMMQTPQVSVPSSSGRSHQKKGHLHLWFPRAFSLRETAANSWLKKPGLPHSLVVAALKPLSQRDFSRRSNLKPQGNKLDDISLMMFFQLPADIKQAPATGCNQVIYF